MDGELIGKRQESPFQLIDRSAESVTMLFLAFAADRGLHEVFPRGPLFGGVLQMSFRL